MKKIISSFIFLLSGIQGFSNTNVCNFVNNPDLFLDRFIKKIQIEKKTNDIFCDRDNTRMVYYTIENENYNANIGIVIKVDQTTSNDEFKKIFSKKFNEYKNFFTKIDTKNLGNNPLPDKEIVRFYVQFPDGKSIIIIGKYEYDLKTKQYQMIVNSKAKEYFEKIQLFEKIPQMQNIAYSDEQIY